MNTIKIVFVLLLVIITGGCSTSAHFKIPDGSKLYLYKREQPVNVAQDGRVVTKPFFWTATAGIPYRLEKDGETIKEGKLTARFRPVSIFWPPLALIYWPMGFNSHTTYDLVNGNGK